MKPKDKALGENAVQQVGRWVLALRCANSVSSAWKSSTGRCVPRLDWLNDRPLTGQTHSRRELFEEIEKAAPAAAAPDYPFEYLEVKQAKVHLDYHVSFEKHHYSVPYQYTRKTVLVRASERLVEIYAGGKTDRLPQALAATGDTAPRKNICPANHRWYLEWSPERFIKWGRQIGPADRSLHPGDADIPPPSRAGLSLLPGDPQAG